MLILAVHYSSITVDEAVSMADFKKDLDFLPYGMETIVGEYGNP